MFNKSIHIIISGKVQGVYYRVWTVNCAKKYNLNGWVRNLANGTVEAVISGDSDTVDKMLQECYVGPENAKVDKIDVKEYHEDVGSGFTQRENC